MANHKRRMFIPLDLPNEDRLELAKLFDEHATLSAIERYAYRHLKVNTHSVRYAGVGKLSDEGVPARVGMKITGLASPGPFSHYVQQR